MVWFVDLYFRLLELVSNTQIHCKSVVLDKGWIITNRGLIISVSTVVQVIQVGKELKIPWQLLSNRQVESNIVFCEPVIFGIGSEAPQDIGLIQVGGADGETLVIVPKGDIQNRIRLIRHPTHSGRIHNHIIEKGWSRGSRLDGHLLTPELRILRF